MATADLYVRVSADEQAIRGFSQRSQEDRLTSYCHYQGITILQVIFEDHPAKTFSRPALDTAYGSLENALQAPPQLFAFHSLGSF